MHLAYESLRSKSYEVATHVRLNPRSCLQRERESKWFIYKQYFPRMIYHYSYSFYIIVKIIYNKMCCVYHLLINPV